MISVIEPRISENASSKRSDSIREIARELKMSRRTVAKYIESVPPWKYTFHEMDRLP